MASRNFGPQTPQRVTFLFTNICTLVTKSCSTSPKTMTSFTGDLVIENHQFLSFTKYIKINLFS
jgi:hypothetical protein